MPDEDEKNVAAPALDSMPPEAPTVVTELPAEFLEGLAAPRAPRDLAPTPAVGYPVQDTGSSPAPEEVDNAWVEDDDDFPTSSEVDVEAPTIAAVLDTSSLGNLPLPGNLKPAPPAAPGEENPASPLASTYAPNVMGPIQAGRSAANRVPPGPAEAPWANPNAPRWQPPVQRPSLVDQPSAIGWAIGGIVVAIVLIVLVGWLVMFIYRNFIAH